MKKYRVRLSHTQIIALGFLIMILTGAVLLTLPIASSDGNVTPFFDSLFTATSASCVTGLIVYDTATHWSLFGQIVIILLIQIGGLGFMTMITFFYLVLGKRVGLKERQIMTESINASQIGGILSITKTILAGTVLFEGCGAILLSIRFIPRYGVGKGIWFGIFHAISAFCNAGFDLLGEGNPYASVTEYAHDPLVTITLMALILIGGLGFLVWEDIRCHGIRWKRYRLQTKVVLGMTALLTFGGAALFYLFESGNLGAGKSVGEQILEALFDSVTARTAGFNTTDTGGLTTPSLLLTYLLMFIGGNSGSTAGGVKTTSIAVIVAFALAGMRRQQGANLFGRRLQEDVLKQAVYIVSANLTLALGGALLIGAMQPLAMQDVLFETFSAIGTVGMTTGITRSLLPASRAVIMALMYLGRVGSVSFGLAVMERKARPAVTFPSESLTVG